MSPFIMDWINLLIRWSHLIAGIGWIGASFYFVALDFSLKKRPKMKPGVLGTAWEVHGGGFYHVEKYMVAPDELPDDLIWYKWEAYLTWMTGIMLMVVQFYWNADIWMIDPNILDIKPSVAIIYSIVSLTAGWFIYDWICKSELGKNTPLLLAAVFILILAAAYFYTHVFSARAALIHVGAFIGTLMAANVFAIIIPNQKKIVASLLKGEKADPKYGIIGKQRSIHNTYLTLPVLVMMVSGHYPIITGHPNAWLLVGLIIIGGALLRHLLIKHEMHEPLKNYVWTLPVIFITLSIAIYMTMPAARQISENGTISNATALQMVEKHCNACHSKNPSHEDFEEAPKGIKFNSTDDLKKYKDLIVKFAIQSDYMPLGNETNMTEDERKQLDQWLANQ